MRTLFLFVLVGAVYGRVKVVIRGESFRAFSHQGSREVGYHGYAPQKAATRSHIDHLLVPLIMDMNYDGVEVHLHTEHSEWEGELRRWYGPFLSQESSTFETLGDYDAVMHIRADMVLKPLFGCALAKADRNKALFSFRCWKNGDTIGGGLDRISDAVTWVPRRLFNHTQDVRAIVNNHDSMAAATPWFGAENIGYMLPGEQHDSDPQKDWNPLYSFADRPEGADIASVTLDWSHLCDI